MKYLSALIAWGLLLCAGSPVFAQSTDSLPVFSLNDLDGKTVTLADYKGKVVVLDFWAIWCSACKEAFPELNKIQSDFGDKGLQVVGINLEKQSPQKVTAFTNKAKIAYKILLDPQGITAATFGIKGVPTLIVIDQTGKIAGKFRGYDKKEGEKIRALLSTLLK